MMYLLIPHLKVINATAISSTYTIGFPAMTAFMGAIHALQRKVTQDERLKEVRLSKMAVSCHSCMLQTYKGPGDYDFSIIGTSNPLKRKGQSFERPPFIEEGRVHLDVSLLVQCDNVHGDDVDFFVERVKNTLRKMKLAGGDILDFGKLECMDSSSGEPETEKKILHSLMPGYVLIERKDLLEKEMVAGFDGMEALLSYLAIEHTAEDDGFQGVRWTSKRKEGGWLVPISVGFKGITPLGKVKEQRNPDANHVFAEPLVTLGEFKMAYRFKHIADILWHYEYDENQQLYICKNEQ